MKNAKKYLILVLCLLWVKALSQDEKKKGFKDKAHVSAQLSTETAYGLYSKSVQKSEWMVTPEFSYKFSHKLQVKGIGRFYTELTDNLVPNSFSDESVSDFTKRWHINKQTTLALRELYADYLINNGISIRIGKQQIVWGETDGLKLLDVVNPQYFREFVLDDFDDSRIPLWALNMQFPIGKTFDVQLLLIPDQSYHVLPNSTGTYFPRSQLPAPPDGMEVMINPIKKPNRVIADSDIGLKVDAFVKGWDVSFHYLYHYNDLPAFYINIEANQLQLDQKMERGHLIGTAFNKAIGELVFRGEMAYHFDKTMLAKPDAFGVKSFQTDQVQTTLGLDWLFQETFLSVQLFHDLIVKDIKTFNRDRLVWSCSFLASQEFMNDKLKLENLLIHDLNRGDGLIRPKASYQVTDQLLVNIGADLFYGNENGVFGQFYQQDRVFIGLEFGL